MSESLQERIQRELGVDPDASIQHEIVRRVQFLCDYARSIPGVRGFVLGISGGQDSSLAGRLAQLAVEKLRSEDLDMHFIAMRLPYGVQSDEDDAQLALEFIEPTHSITVNIKPMVDALLEGVSEGFQDVGLSGAISDFNKGNVKARARMIAQYAVAGERSMLVIGTDHAAEAVNGFFTKFGDGAADVLPLAGLTKSQGAKMLERLGAPSRLWEKAPTADLLDGVPGRTDEAELGVSYRMIDDYLTGKSIPDGARENIERRFLTSQHKREMPVTPDDTWWRAKANG